MNLEILTYVLYLVIGVATIVAVGVVLARNGQVFLEESASGDRRAAASMNHLLQVGYYLLAFGLLAATMRTGDVSDAAGVFSVLSVKVGVLLLLIAAVYALNLSVFSSSRRTRRLAASYAARPQTYPGQPQPMQPQPQSMQPQPTAGPWPRQPVR